MWKKIAIAGGIAAAVVGSGTAALAVADDNGSGTPSASATPSPGGSAATTPSHAGKAKAGKVREGLKARAQNFEHGEWLSKNGTTTQTHDAIHGTVSVVSATSISVKADDGFSLTFTVNGDTKVASRPNGEGKAAKSAIASVKSGDHVFVTGVKSGSTPTAKHVLDTGTK